MKIKYTIFYVLAASMFVLQNICMELQVIPQNNQQYVTLPVSDGNFSIEKKKLFGSATLREHYLKNKAIGEATGKLPLFPLVTVEEMELYSDALDYVNTPLFKDHVDSLLYEKRNKLLSLSQKYGAQASKIENFRLTLGLIDACLPADICQHIKSYLDPNDTVEYIIQRKVDHEVKFLPQQKYSDLRAEKCLKGTVSDYMWNTGFDGSIKDTYNSYMSFSDQFVFKLIDGDKWQVCCSRKNKDRQGHYYFCYITPTKSESCDQLSRDIFDQLYVWVTEDKNRSINKICIEHIGKITALSFHPTQNVFVSCAYSNNKSSIKLWNFKGDCIGKLPEVDDNYVVQVCFNKNGNCLLVNLIGSVTSSIVIWEVDNLNAIKNFKTISRPGNDFFCYVLMGIDPRFGFIATTHSGCYVFMTTKRDTAGIYECVSHELGNGIKNLYFHGNAIVSVMDKRKLDAINMWNATKKTYMFSLLCSDVNGSDKVLLRVDLLNNKIHQYRMSQHKNDPRIEWLMNKPTLLQFIGLRALCAKHKGNKRVQLHQDGLAAWIIQSLPADKESDVVGLVNTCFSVERREHMFDLCEKIIQENSVIQ